MPPNNDNSRLRRVLKSTLREKQNRIIGDDALLGDGYGVVATGDPNMVYARVAGGVVARVYNDRVPLLHDLPVKIGFDPLHPSRLRVLDRSEAPIYGQESADYINVGNHGSTHRVPLGRDPVWVELRQFMPLRLSPITGTLTVHLYPGVVKLPDGTYQEITGAVYDLAAYVPATSGKARFTKVTISTAGAVTFTAGAEVDIADLDATTVPAAPADTAYELGMVRTYYGQTEIIEAASDTDIWDLRFPMPHTHSASGLLLYNDAEGNPTSVDATGASDGTSDYAARRDHRHQLGNHDHSGDAGDGGAFPLTNLSSGAAPAGQTPTADGSGGIAWGMTSGGATYAADDVSNPPTQEELTAAFGAPVTAGQGFLGLLDDGGLGVREYLAASDGSKWLYAPLAVARSSYETDTLTRQGVVLPGEAGEENYVVEASVMVEGGLWKMWYRYGGWSGTPGIGYATSPDGLNWTKSGSNPLLSGYFCPFVFKDGAIYHLYGVTTAWNQLDHYTSSDGLTWALDTANVLALGGGGAWDAYSFGNVFVWKEGASDWRMIYEARASGGVWKLGYATSADGNTWTKSGSNPVVDETGGVGGPFVYKSGSTYYLWAHRAASGLLPTDIARYQSTDLTTWTDDGLQVTRTGADEGAGSAVGQVADPHIVVHNGVIYLFYEGSPDGDTGTGTTNIKVITGKESLIWD